MSPFDTDYDELSLNSTPKPSFRGENSDKIMQGADLKEEAVLFGLLNHDELSLGHTVRKKVEVSSPQKTSVKKSTQLSFPIIKIIAIVLGVTVLVGVLFAFASDKEQQAYGSIATTEKQIENASKSGGDTEALYAQLLEKQRHLDSLLETRGEKGVRQYDDTVDYFIDAVMSEFYDDNYTLPPALRKQIKEYVEMFTVGYGKKGMQKVISRRDTYFPYVQQVFREKKVPDVLKYVAMQESLLNPKAKSHVGAGGLWQFMPATARSYGLKVGGGQDERYEWQKATLGAALYFRKLLSLFGKGDGVLLAIASYNAGENKIQRALGKVEDPLLNRNFGYLYRTSTLLAKETREYVPKILARAIVDQNRGYYGFE